MARAQDETSSLRFSRRESARLRTALVLSVLAHLLVGGGYWAGNQLGVWKKLHPPAWLALIAKTNPPKEKKPEDTEPTIFVDVSQADADAPVKPKYYSYKNSHAANPVEANANVPQISGKQTEVPKTENVPKVLKKEETAPTPASAKPPSNLQPSAPPPAQAQPEAPQTPGETERLIKPKTDTTPPTKTTQPQPERPRTLRDALAQRNQLPGQQMQQAGGVPRHALSSSLDAKATPFGEYDRAIIEAVTQRWYDLLDSHRYAQDRAGKVTLSFKLMSDGTIIEMKPLENTVGDLLGYLCQESIEEAAPFGKWPPDMVRMIGANYREITFTFYYY